MNAHTPISPWVYYLHQSFQVFLSVYSWGPVKSFRSDFRAPAYRILVTIPLSPRSFHMCEHSFFLLLEGEQVGGVSRTEQERME